MLLLGACVGAEPQIQLGYGEYRVCRLTDPQVLVSGEGLAPDSPYYLSKVGKGVLNLIPIGKGPTFLTGSWGMPDRSGCQIVHARMAGYRG